MYRLGLLLILGLTSTDRGIAFTNAASRNKNHFGLQRSEPFDTMATRGGSRSSPLYTLEATTEATHESFYNAGEIVAGDPFQNRGPLKVLFLSSDTGGGHRASAESLAKQFLIHFPGSSYDLLDVWTTDGVVPYRTLVKSYKHLSAHPRQWRLLYHASNTAPWIIYMDWHSTLTCERRIRRRIASYNPDVIVSVHPAMNGAPRIAVKKISKSLGKHIPFFTVVTDLGSGHTTWFSRKVERIYLASERLRRLAKRRGWCSDDKIVMTGLPIRHDFAIQADRMGDRTTPEGKEYRKSVKKELGLDPERPMVLVMGGGEGVGSLSSIVNELYVSFAREGIDATICVVCGRNEKLKASLAERDWNAVLAGKRTAKRRFLIPLLGRRRSKIIQDSLDRASHDETTPKTGKVEVVGLGFITGMADYMVAADILVSKAGPGTIAEAASVGLPIMMTSFLPGQEAGNVDFVLENSFGDYCSDPRDIAEEVACWIKDPNLLEEMSHNAKAVGRPHAAADIVLDIGSITHAWKALNSAGGVAKL